MTWNGSGTFDPPGGPEFPAVANDLIRAAYYNTVIRALCTAFDNTVPRDGQAPLLGDVNGNKLYTMVQIRAAQKNGDAVRFEEFVALQNLVNALGTPIEPFVYLRQGII